MNSFKLFLESSTIHGLNHVSTTRKYIRFFWILVVISGFSGSIYLICQSFKAWSERPVSTTIETHEIHELKYPKVMVCPPKNTYTNLNHDIMVVGNMTIDNDLTNENSTAYKLLQSFVSNFHQKDFDVFVQKINLMKEKNEFRNYYNGFTKVPIDVYRNQIGINSGKFIKTYATSGDIASPYFGEVFDSDKFELGDSFSVHIENPYNDFYRKEPYGNTTYKIKYDVEEQFECLQLENRNGACLDPSQNEFQVKKANDSNGIRIIFTRSFQTLDFEDWKLKRFTGFSVEWEYLRTQSDTKIQQSFQRKNKNYIRMANLIHQSNSAEVLWNFVKQQKVDWMPTISQPDVYGYGPYETNTLEDMYDNFFKNIGQQLNLTPWTTPLYENDITDEVLKTAAEMFLYIMSPQQEYWVNWYNEYSEWLSKSSLRRILGRVNSSILQFQFQQVYAKFFQEYCPILLLFLVGNFLIDLLNLF